MLTFEEPGGYLAALTVTDRDGASATDDAEVRVNPRGAAVMWTGQVADAALGHVELSARLSDQVDAPSARLAGRTIGFHVGGESYTATTDALGDARVGLPVVLPEGTHGIRVTFAADSHYLGVETTATVTVGEAPPEVFLVIDEESIREGARFHSTGGTLTPSGPSFFRSHDVYGARSSATHRLRSLTRYTPRLPMASCARTSSVRASRYVLTASRRASARTRRGPRQGAA